MADLKEMLKVANVHSLAAANVEAQPYKEPVFPDPADTQRMIPADDDPFNGNLNNRRVAERIAAEGWRVKWLNRSQTTHIGDPIKAAADVAKSKAVMPDDVAPDDDAPVPLPTTVAPTPGSPAAAKLAKATEQPPQPTTVPPGAPPSWKPGN